MIASFKCKNTVALAEGFRVGRFGNFERIALRKLRQLQVVGNLIDLRVPPGNRLEALKGQTFIRVNAFVFAGREQEQKMWRLWTTTMGQNDENANPGYAG